MASQYEDATTDANESTAAAAASTTNTTNNNSNKVKVHFVATGSAPILKKTKFQIQADQRFASVVVFLRKTLKLPEGASLFLYCHSAFVPSPDQNLGDLRDCFAIRDELVIHYSLQEAWG